MFILGCGLLWEGRSEGYILVVMGLVLAVVGIPQIRFIVGGIAKGVYSRLFADFLRFLQSFRQRQLSNGYFGL